MQKLTSLFTGASQIVALKPSVETPTAALAVACVSTSHLLAATIWDEPLFTSPYSADQSFISSLPLSKK